MIIIAESHEGNNIQYFIIKPYEIYILDSDWIVRILLLSSASTLTGCASGWHPPPEQHLGLSKLPPKNVKWSWNNDENEEEDGINYSIMNSFWVIPKHLL